MDAPAVWFVDETKHMFIMENIDGPTAKVWIDAQEKLLDKDTFEVNLTGVL